MIKQTYNKLKFTLPNSFATNTKCFTELDFAVVIFGLQPIAWLQIEKKLQQKEKFNIKLKNNIKFVSE